MEKMSFGIAIEEMKRGKRVAREGWNGKDMFIYFMAGSHIKRSDPRSSEAASVREGIHEEKDDITICPHIDMKAADDSIVVGWLASQTDMLAEDWFIV